MSLGATPYMLYNLIVKRDAKAAPRQRLQYELQKTGARALFAGFPFEVAHHNAAVDSALPSLRVQMLYMMRSYAVD